MKRKRAAEDIVKRTLSLQRQKTMNQAQVQRMVKKALDRSVDLKGVDLSHNGVLIQDLTNNTDVVPIGLVALGDGMFRRKDREITLKSIRLKIGATCTYKHDTASGHLHNTSARFTLVWDTKPQDSPPKWNDIFGNLSDGGVVSANFRSTLLFQNTDRFRVLRDEIIPINQQVYAPPGLFPGLETAQYSIERDWYVDLKGKKSIYTPNHAAATLSGVEQGILYLVSRASYAADHTSTAYHANARVRFTDL